MKVYHQFAEAGNNVKNAVVTTGSFDGVHVGHKVIIDRLNEIARETGGESVLVTFSPHPRKVLYPDHKNMKLINSQEEKIELLKKAGLQNLLIVRFTLEFSKTTSREFVSDMLVGELGARVVVVGHGHHFGYARQGDYSYLYGLGREMGFAVEEIPLKDIENEVVSSTKIRKALSEGNIQRANAYLDHQYIITGALFPGLGNPLLPANPTIGIEVSAADKLIPPPGIYAGNLLAGKECLKCMIFIFDSPDSERKVECFPVFDTVLPGARRGTLYFYKEIWRGNPLNMAELSEDTLSEARETVEELIY